LEQDDHFIYVVEAPLLDAAVEALRVERHIQGIPHSSQLKTH